MHPNSVLSKRQRNAFLFFTTFLVACGLVILSLGMTYHVSHINSSFFVEDSSIDTAAILLVVVGFITFPVAYLTFYTAVKGKLCLIRISSFAVLATAVSTILTGVLYVSFVHAFKINLREKDAAAYRWTHRREFMVFWDTIHFLLNCCGYGEGNQGWLPNLPASCCFQQVPTCQPHFAFRTDCKDVCCNGTSGLMTGYVSIVIGTLELVGAFLIFILYWFTQGKVQTKTLEKPLEKS